MKRGAIKTIKVYFPKEKLTKFAVQVKLRSGNWVQAKKGDIPLIYDTREEADQVVIDYVKEMQNIFVKGARK